MHQNTPSITLKTPIVKMTSSISKAVTKFCSLFNFNMVIENFLFCGHGCADRLDVCSAWVLDFCTRLMLFPQPRPDVCCNSQLLFLPWFWRSTSADTSFANRQRYPTFVSFGPTGQGGHVPSLKLFLQRYSWTTVTVFCENLANYLNVASFFGLTCRGIKSIIMAGSDHFTVYYEDFDSRKPETNFQAMLERAKSQSRGTGNNAQFKGSHDICASSHNIRPLKCAHSSWTVIIIESREDIVQKMMVRGCMIASSKIQIAFARGIEAFFRE